MKLRNFTEKNFTAEHAESAEILCGLRDLCGEEIVLICG